MSKAIFFTLLLTLSGACLLGQTVRRQTDTSKYIAVVYFVTHPGGFLFGDGHFFAFNGDTLSVWDTYGKSAQFGTRYDTAYYKLTNNEEDSILQTIAPPDTLKSAVNPCIMDGFIFSVWYKSGGKEHVAWVSNAYDERLFLFVDVINRHVPENFKIHYDREGLITETQECLTRLHRY
jgi:hypothetical protein